MLWSKHLKILGFSAIALIGMPILAACTLTPVYSGRLAQANTLNLTFAEPATRLDQIIIQDLALHFGNSDAAGAHLVTVRSSAGAKGLFNTNTADPNKAYAVTVTAILTIAPPADQADAAPITLTRRATASYESGVQVLNDQSAATEASERAAKAAAESLRLAVLANFVR